MLSPRRSSLYCFCACIANSLLELGNNRKLSLLSASCILLKGRFRFMSRANKALMPKFFSLLAVKRQVHGRVESGILFKRPIIRY